MLSSYRFGTRTARHLFCRTCGVKSFYLPRSHPDGVSVNVRCLAPETVAGIRVRPFDGANWEEHQHELDRVTPAAHEKPADPEPPAPVRAHVSGCGAAAQPGRLAARPCSRRRPGSRAGARSTCPAAPGHASEALHRLGFQVTAADLDASAFAGSREIRFEKLDLDLPLPFADASFELVHCGDGIEHLESPLRALRELARVLAPGGSLLLTTPNYGSLERRLRFLLSGSLAKPLPRGRTGRRPRRARPRPPEPAHAHANRLDGGAARVSRWCPRARCCPRRASVCSRRSRSRRCSTARCSRPSGGAISSPSRAARPTCCSGAASCCSCSRRRTRAARRCRPILLVCARCSTSRCERRFEAPPDAGLAGLHRSCRLERMGRARPRAARDRGTPGPQRRGRRALLHDGRRLRVRRGALLRAAQADDLPRGARRHSDHDEPLRRGAARARRRGNPADLALPLRFRASPGSARRCAGW